MITLKTLATSSAQEVFDQVVNHLLTQKKASKSDNGGCLYRYGRLKCAAGCLIADDEYTPDMDSGGVSKVDTNWESLVEAGIVPNTVHNKLIMDLQEIHDLAICENWQSSLSKYADENDLQFNWKGE